MGKSYAQKIRAKQNRSKRNGSPKNGPAGNVKNRSNEFPIAPVVVIVIVIALIIATIVMYQAQNGDDGNGDPENGDNGGNGENQPGDIPLHALIGLESIEGSMITLEQYEGKVVVIDMFATWCGPCADQMDELIELRNRFSEDELVILSIDTDLQETREDVISFKNDYPGARWPFALSNMDFNMHFPATNIPTLYILDKNLNIAVTEVGVTSASVLQQKVNQLL